MKQKRERPLVEVSFYVVAPSCKALGRDAGLHEVLSVVRAGWQPPGIGLRLAARNVDNKCGACIMNALRSAILVAAAVVYPQLKAPRDTWTAFRRLGPLARSGGKGYNRHKATLTLARSAACAPDSPQAAGMQRAQVAAIKAIRRAGFDVALTTDAGEEELKATGRWKSTCGLHELRGTS